MIEVVNGTYVNRKYLKPGDKPEALFHVNSSRNDYCGNTAIITAFGAIGEMTYSGRAKWIGRQRCVVLRTHRMILTIEL